MVKFNKLPSYMQVFANKKYQNEWLSGILDDNRVAKLCSWGTNKKIIKDILKNVTKNAHILQIGLCFGDEMKSVYEKVGAKGKVDIFDVSDTQVGRAEKKYADCNVNIMNYNAALPWDEKYDVVICYNLLHELPLRTRQEVMDNALNCLANGGKAIFVDYAEPKWWNPLKWPLFLYNRLFNPFAESLWHTPIENFCSVKQNYRWNHTYYYGRMYQKTIAVRKILSSEDVLHLTKVIRN